MDLYWKLLLLLSGVFLCWAGIIWWLAHWFWAGVFLVFGGYLLYKLKRHYDRERDFWTYHENPDQWYDQL